MAKQPYLPKPDADRVLWLNNFNAKLPAYMSKYGLTPNDELDVANISSDFAYRLQATHMVNAYNKQWTAYKNALRDGLPAGAEVQPPMPPNLGSVPVAVAPGGFTRIQTLVKRIKASSAYSVADGLDMGIEGVETVVDYTTLTPQVSIRTGSGGFPEIVWAKQGMDGIAIYKDNGDTRGFVLYDLDNHPNWQDKHALPPAGQSEIWKYKIIFRTNDEEVGQWSSVLSVTVTG